MGRCHAHGGTEFSISSCIPSKYINQGKTLESSFHQKSLPYRPNHFSLTTNSGSHELGPRVTKMIHGFPRFLMAFVGNMNIHLGFPMCQPRSSSQGFKRTHQGPRALMLTLLSLAFPRNGIDSSLQLVSLESLWPSSLLLHVLCVDRDPSVPTSGTKPEDTTRFFHFSLPLDFDKTSNESFLLSRIHVSGLFYLMGRPHHSLDLLSRPHPS